MLYGSRQCLAALLFVAAAGCARNRELRHADDAFAQRDDVGNLRSAVEVLEAVPQPMASQYDVLWRLTKYRYYLSTRETDGDTAAKLLESAIASGEQAVKLDSSQPDAHFWLAAAYGEYAASQTSSKALALVPEIRREYEASLEIDPQYENGAAWEALGELDLRLPSFYGGDRRRGIERLERGAEIAPTNADLLLTLARSYAAAGRTEDARKLVDEILASSDPLKTPAEQEKVYEKARELRARLP